MEKNLNKTILSNFVSQSVKVTLQLGQQFGTTLKGGTNIVLDGEIGTGKTTFAKGIAQGLGIQDQVSSPSFNIINFYQGSPWNLCHIDLYRMQSEQEVQYLGLEEYFQKNTISIIEWGKNFLSHIPDPKIQIYLSITKHSNRYFTIHHDHPSH